MNLRVLKGSSLAFAMPDGTTITWQARSNDCLPENQSKLTGHKWCDTFDCDCGCHDTDQSIGDTK